VLEHLASLREPGEQLTLQPLAFNQSADSATITALPSNLAAGRR
jgi:hypothetical protein